MLSSLIYREDGVSKWRFWKNSPFSQGQAIDETQWKRLWLLAQVTSASAYATENTLKVVHWWYQMPVHIVHGSAMMLAALRGLVISHGPVI